MTQEERRVLKTLDKIVRSEVVRAQIEPIVERVCADLSRRSDRLMTWEPIALGIFGDQFPYLIPLGMIFIVMIIFLPQGLLGFARRWLNR